MNLFIIVPQTSQLIMNPIDQLLQYILKMAEITPKGGNFTLDSRTANLLVNREAIIDTDLITRAWKRSLEKNAMIFMESISSNQWKFYITSDAKLIARLQTALNSKAQVN